MRKILIVFVVLLMSAPLAVRSQNVLIAHLKTGQVYELAFKADPVITFSETEAILTFKVNGVPQEIKCPLIFLTKFTFSTKDLTDPTIPTQVDDLEESHIQFLIEDYTVTISGAKADMVVRLFSADGRQIDSYKTDKEGSVTFSIAEQPAGTYIVNSEEITFKFLKK